jgi:hypothetical protein
VSIEDVKRAYVARCGPKWDIDTLIETGCGSPANTIDIARHWYSRVISIELDEENYQEAALQFIADHRVTLLHGDSAVLLRRVLEEIRKPVVFWLDAHYNGRARGVQDVPVLEELRAILSLGRVDDFILIDDLRLFEAEDEGFPPVQAVSDLTLATHDLTTADDMITLTPLTRLRGR